MSADLDLEKMINTVIAGIFGVSLLFYLYRVIRPMFKIRVNCWFCNSNQWVLYDQRNSFTCKKCDQYNGFDKNGDYNKFIAAQRVETLNSRNPTAKKIQFTTFPSTNGLCQLCNQKQAVIIERLNKFEAVDERRYFEEYESYKISLNQQYPLCQRCQEFTDQKLASVNERYLPKSPVKKAASVFSQPSVPRFRPQQCRPVLNEENDDASVSERYIPKSPVKKAASVFSQSSVTSRRSHQYPPILNEENEDEEMDYSVQKPKHNHENKRRKLYFASGKITVLSHIITFMISFILFISLYDSSQISSGVRFLALEKYFPMDTVTALHQFANNGALVSLFAFGFFCYGLNKSDTRVNFVDLLAVVSWPLFSIFCIFDVQRNPDFNLIKMIFSGYLFLLSTMILLIPKKRKHLKRPNNFYSAFSVASTRASQCSSRLTASRIHNLTNRSNLSQTSKNDSVPDLVEEWVSKTVPGIAEKKTLTNKLHDLRI